MECGLKLDYIWSMRPVSVSRDIVPLGEFKARAAGILRRLAGSASPLVITQNGRPAAVLLAPEEFDRLCDRLARLERYELKEAARADDARDLASGAKTPAQLAAANGAFAFPRSRVRLNMSRTKHY